MKITRLAINSILGIRELDLRPSKPVVVVTAANGQGKTSIVNALALALAYQLPRIDKQKDAGATLHDGATVGVVEVWADKYKDHFAATVMPGKVSWKNPAGEEGPSFIEYVLNPPLFASQPVAERRSMLYRLLGLDLTPEGIKARLIAKGCDDKKAEDMAPILRAGFESAQKHAAGKATESKGAFRAVTNETWGSSKGATWRAPTPPFSGEQAAELHGIDQSIASAGAELADANQRLGIAEHEAKRERQRTDQVAHLKPIAAKLDEHLMLVEKTSAELKELEDELADAKQKAKGKPLGIECECPDCGVSLVFHGGKLALWTQDASKYDRDAEASIPGIEKAIATMRAVVARHTKNRDDAQTAALNLEMLEKQTPAKAVDPEPIRQTVETLKTSIATMRKRQAELQDAQRKLDEADAKTAQARQHHADVLAWDAIAKALSPDGIPSEILGEALDPFNKRLATSSNDTKWGPVAIDADMAITYGGRPLGLCSESETWRANAIIAEAISFLSGLKFAVLDRADVLDAEGWAQLMKWADTLAYEQDIDTMLILATTDGEPEGLTDLMQCVRIEAGAIAGEKQREAVAA